MNKDNSGFIYLASPYSHPEESVRDFRVEQVFLAAAELLNDGIIVFSPIIHTYQLEQRIDPELAQDHSFWMRMDIAVLKHAARLVVLRLPGWEQSKGVAEEIAVAHACHIPVSFYEVGQ